MRELRAERRLRNYHAKANSHRLDRRLPAFPLTGPPPQAVASRPGGDATPDQRAHAEREIEQLVNQYCAELETLQAARIKRLFPYASDPQDEQLRYRSLKCSLTTALTFVRLDADPNGGAAQLVFGMKQEIATKASETPVTTETVVTMLVSRKTAARLG